MNASLRAFSVLWFLLLIVFPAATESYWDEIELIDGQVLRGAVVDTVKGLKVIQLTTRDFISLPQTSVVRTVTAQERRKQAEAKLALPPAKVDLGLAVVTPSSPAWKASWAAVRYQASQTLGIELEDGQVFQANWLDTTRGQAAFLLADGRILVLDRSAIRRVSAVIAAVPAEPALTAAPAEPSEPFEPGPPAPDLLGPFIAGIGPTLDAWFPGPPGADPTSYRSFFAPTARLAAPGRLSVDQLDGAATQVTFGVTDTLQVQASTSLPTLAIADLPTYWLVGAQVAVPLPWNSPPGLSTRLSGGQWIGRLRSSRNWSEPAFLGFLNFTVRTEDLGSMAWESTFMTGYLLQSGSRNGEVVLGTLVRLDTAPGVAVLVDLLTSLILADNVGSRTTGILGFRFWHGQAALDLGVQGIRQVLWEEQTVDNGWWGGRSTTQVRNDTAVFYPVLNLSYRF